MLCNFFCGFCKKNLTEREWGTATHSQNNGRLWTCFSMFCKFLHEEFSKFSLKCEIAGKNFTAIPQDSSHGCRNHISGLQWRVFKVFSEMWDRRQEFHCNSTGLITRVQESHQWSSMKSFQSFLWNVRSQARISLQFHRTHHMGAGITSVVFNEEFSKFSLKCEIAAKNFIEIAQDSSHGCRNHISGLQWRVFKVFSEMWDRRQEFHCNSTGLITCMQESYQWSSIKVFSEMWDRRQEFHCNSIGLITWAQESHQKLAKSHTVVGTYRPPSASLTDFNDIYVQNLDTLNDRENIFVLGDFNVDFLSECRNDISAHILECQMVVCGHYSRCPAVITNGAWSLIAEGLSFCAKISFVLER